MKFLCGNCKAKYQIADEKVTGRTLRMKCRRCGHDILIDGHVASPSSVPAPAPRRTSTVSVVPPSPGRGAAVAHAPAALPRPAVARASQPPSGPSADFRRHVAAPPEVPQRHAPYDLWHVAIQDVPVGPMTRDELSRKIEAGAVVPESLCWREGMDEWRPLGELAELAGLLRRSRDAVLRAPRARVTAPGPAPRPAPPPPVESNDDDVGEPTRISAFMPSLVQASAAQLPPPSVAGGIPANVGFPAPSPVAVSEPARPAAKGTSDRTTGIVIGMLAMVLLLGGPLLYRNTWGSTQHEAQKPAPAATAPVQQPPPTPAPPAPPTDDDDVQLTIDPSEVAENDRLAGQRGAARVPKADNGKGKALSDEQKRLLERMGGGGNDPDLRAVGGAHAETGGAGGAVPAALTPAQLTKVVQDNKTQLQRCYETALRAAGGKQEGAVKVTVSVVVGTSGATKSVSTQGDGLGNMTDCLRTSVKRWRFPPSQGDSEFAFPLVFQPGA